MVGDSSARILGVGLVASFLAFFGSEDLGLERFTVPKELVLALSAAGAAVTFLGRPRATFPDRRLLAACAVLVLLLVFASLGATNPWSAARTVLGAASAAVVLLLAIALAAEGQAGVLVRSVAVATVAVSVVALAESVGIIPRLSMFGRAPGGTIGNRNFLSHLLVIGAPFVVLELFADHRLRARAAWAFGLGCIVAAVAATRCRASWLAGLVLFAGTAAAISVRWSGLERSSRRAWASVALAGLIGAVAGILLFGRALGWSPRDYGATLSSVAAHPTGTGRGRLVQYETSLRMLGDQPLLGVGPGQWSVAYPIYAAPGDPSFHPEAPIPMNRLPSSDWIGFATEAGLPALAVALVIAGLLFRHAVARGIGRSAHAAALVASLAALIVVGAFDAVLFRPEAAFLSAVALGAAAGAYVPEIRRDVLLPRRVSLGLVSVVLSLAVALAGGRMAASVLRASGKIPDLQSAFRLDPGNFVLATTIAYRHEAFGRCDAAAPYAQAALRLYPAAGVPRAVLRRCADGSKK